ncbi:protein 4.1-like isoform X3 [Protopterus annectens]|uniref:protein 4.1-like isoform X3 n=1 Tax=Protopterus annectens TaxID=7888 RepID=UPI001CFAD694|nr:protein 4.1-like isoform X3 [Protopterus annectens]
MTTEVNLVEETKNPSQQQQQQDEVETDTVVSSETKKGKSEEDPKQVAEVEAQQDQEQKTASGTPANGETPTHVDQTKGKERASGGKGLSRLLSSFLKKPKSQISEEGKDTGEVKEKKEEDHKGTVQEVLEGEVNVEEEIELKAPIADPEPELRTEADPALDLHSLSSAETQPANEDQRDEEDQDLEEDQEDTGEEKSEKKTKKGGSEIKASEGSQKPVRRYRTMHCKVSLLDDTTYECDLEKHTKGQELMKKVCDHINLIEGDYFGLAMWDSQNTKVWLDPLKEIRKQVHVVGGSWNFAFSVKFYPPDPAQLTEDITRYYLCLQLRQDILTGRLPCSFATLALLGSYTIQSELGDYDPDLHGLDYVGEFKLAPNQTKELEEKVMELHKSYRCMTPAQADLQFLENAKKLSMYGVDLHQAKDLEGVDILLGVCSSGLLVYKDKLRINRFPWPKVLKISYKRSSFFIKIRPGEQEQYESTIGFKLPNYRASKKLWKVCVEHHAFFRLASSEVTPKSKFLALGSKFRYSGRTHAQTRHASALIDRPAPQFERTASKRASRSLDGAKRKEHYFRLRHVEHEEEMIIPDLSLLEMVQEFTAKHVPSEIHLKPVLEEESDAVFADQNYFEPDRELPAAVTVTPDRSLRPTSAPVIAQSHSDEAGVLPPTSFKEVEVCSVVKEPKIQEKPDEKVVQKVVVDPIEVKVRKEQTEVTTPTVNGNHLQHPPAPNEELIRMRKDLDKTQDEIMKHHASISELKKNFMESVPEPRPNEWDKRLSTQSPFRTLNVNGQIHTGIEGVKRTTVSPSQRNLDGPENVNEMPNLKADELTEGVNASPDSTLQGQKQEVACSDSQRATPPESPRVCASTPSSSECSEDEEQDEGASYFLQSKEDLSCLNGSTLGLEPHAEASEESEEETPEISSALPPDNCKEEEEEEEENKATTAPAPTPPPPPPPAEDTDKKCFTPEIQLVTINGDYCNSHCESGSPLLIRCFQPPLVKTQTVTISNVSDTLKSEIPTKEVPIVHTETKTITYEAAQGSDGNTDAEPAILLSAQTITSETKSTTTTTQITKTVKGGVSETRIEKRIVISGDADIDHDQALAQAIKEAKEQHPDMSVTKVVVHQETEIDEQ